jgi:hypothetical protein
VRGCLQRGRRLDELDAVLKALVPVSPPPRATSCRTAGDPRWVEKQTGVALATLKMHYGAAGDRRAHVYAPAGRIELRKQGNYVGAFVGNEVRAGKGAIVQADAPETPHLLGRLNRRSGGSPPP